ncbi:MAG TPA: hypothetical protein VIZ66_09675 [Sphingomicrobium sp.]
MSAFLALVGAAAFAADDPGIPADRKRQLMAEYATCVVKHMRGKAKSVVLSNRESSAAVARFDDVLSPECMPVNGGDGLLTMRTWPILIREALAQALLQTESSLGLPSLATTPPLEHGTTTKSSSKGADLGIAMSRLGECVVRAAPDASTKLIRTDIAGPAESAAFDHLKPAVSSCLSAGQTIEFSPEMLRGAIALNVYRLAKAGEKK